MSTITNVNIFIKAKDPTEAVQLQLLVNYINDIHYHYQTPIELKDGSFLVWFFAETTEYIDYQTVDLEAVNLIRGEQ